MMTTAEHGSADGTSPLTESAVFAFLATLYREPREYLNAGGLKHDAENWAEAHLGVHIYISQDDVVEAARQLGWSCKRWIFDDGSEGPHLIRRNYPN